MKSYERLLRSARNDSGVLGKPRLCHYREHRLNTAHVIARSISDETISARNDIKRQNL